MISDIENIAQSHPKLDLTNDSITFKVNILSEKHMSDLAIRKRGIFAGCLDKFRKTLPHIHRKSYMIGFPVGHALDPLAFQGI